MRISDWSSDVCSSDLRIYLFGFSRGAWTARVLAGLIHLIGLVRPSQLNMCDNALATYKRAARDNKMPIARSEERRFGKEYVSTCRSRWSHEPLTKTLTTQLFSILYHK